MRRGALAACVLLAGCAAATIAPAPGTAPGAAAADDAVAALIEAALAADARLDGADSLYAPGAQAIADGRVRLDPPLYAGVRGPGEVAITASQVSVAGTLAWGRVQYRWISADSTDLRAGVATVLAAPRRGGGGWWIVHAHSSTAR